ncbi:MAG: transcription termination/antitermination protein NusG [Anaerolineae bacterium]|nr:transcription termination/antitermination protein NusG [Anaerolineae bacterium]
MMDDFKPEEKINPFKLIDDPANKSAAKATPSVIGSQPVVGPVIGDENASLLDAPITADAKPEEFEWYFVNCYSGYENKVKINLMQRVETMGVAHLIKRVVVPTEQEAEIRDGKRRTVERRLFPGYILVQMKLNDESKIVVQSTPGVSRFIGMGETPEPLPPQQVAQILKRMETEAPKLKVSFKTGQKIRIIEGPFADFPGTVEKIDTERAKITVLVSFFGRDTPVELDFLQVERS